MTWVTGRTSDPVKNLHHFSQEDTRQELANQISPRKQLVKWNWIVCEMYCLLDMHTIPAVTDCSYVSFGIHPPHPALTLFFPAFFLVSSLVALTQSYLDD